MVRATMGIVTIVAACNGVLISSMPCDADEVNVGRIAQVWAEREKRVKAYRTAWSETTTYPKGTPYIDPRANPKDLPTTDLTATASCRMVIVGHKSRFEYYGQMWSTESRKMGPAVDIMTFDGARSASTSLQSPLIGNPQVILKKATESPQSRSPELLPVWLTARASIVSAEMPIEQFVPTRRKEKVNNSLCHEFSRNTSGTVRERVFLDPERDYQVTRYSYYVNDMLWMKLEIGYQSDPTLGWVPAAWDFAMCNKKSGAIELNKRCVVTEFGVNVDVSESEPVQEEVLGIFG